MRKRLPKMGNGGRYMSDVDRKMLRKAQPGTETGLTQTSSTETDYGQIFNNPNRTVNRPYEATESGYRFLDDGSFVTYEQADSLGNVYGSQQPLFMMTPQQRAIYDNLMGVRKRGGSTQKRKGKNWIKGAIKKPGALRATAKRAGAMKKDGTIKKSWLQQQAKKGNTKTAQRARLALTLGKMKK